MLGHVADCLRGAAEPEPEPDLKYESANSHPMDAKAVPKLAVGNAVSKGSTGGAQDAAAAKKGLEVVRAVPKPKQKHSPEGGKLPAVKKLPPWFKGGNDSEVTFLPS